MSEYTDLADLVTFRPLERPIRCLHRVSPFSAGWSSTVEALGRELRLHGARQTVLEADFRETDLRLDGLPRADRTARSPGIVISFKATAVPNHPDLRYEVGTFSKWQDNVRAVALALEALRAVDRYGVTRRGEQYAGWKQLTEVSAQTPEQARELLALHAGLDGPFAASPLADRDLFRRAAKRAQHVDDSEGVMNAVMNAGRTLGAVT